MLLELLLRQSKSIVGEIIEKKGSLLRSNERAKNCYIDAYYINKEVFRMIVSFYLISNGIRLSVSVRLTRHLNTQKSDSLFRKFTSSALRVKSQWQNTSTQHPHQVFGFAV